LSAYPYLGQGKNLKMVKFATRKYEIEKKLYIAEIVQSIVYKISGRKFFKIGIWEHC